MGLFGLGKAKIITADRALTGRSTPVRAPERHHVSGHRIQPPFPGEMRTAVFGMGCFWGAERIFWQTSGVYSTAVGYAGGFTENPTYEEACSGRTGHTEAVLVVFDPARVGYEQLLTIFWEGHDPTQGMRQGNDRGSQYRSAAYWADDGQRALVTSTAAAFGAALQARRYGEITTETAPLGAFYYAEDHHQQYLAKVPNGYCGIRGTGVSCPAGTP